METKGSEMKGMFVIVIVQDNDGFRNTPFYKNIGDKSNNNKNKKK